MPQQHNIFAGERFGEFNPYHEMSTVKLLTARGRVVTAAGQTMETWIAKQAGYITDFVAGGTVSDIKALYLDSDEIWYMPSTALAPYDQSLKSPIRFDEGAKFQVKNLIATSGTHYVAIRGIYTRMQFHSQDYVETIPLDTRSETDVITPAMEEHAALRQTQEIANVVEGHAILSPHVSLRELAATVPAETTLGDIIQQVLGKRKLDQT